MDSSTILVHRRASVVADVVEADRVFMLDVASVLVIAIGLVIVVLVMVAIVLEVIVVAAVGFMIVVVSVAFVERSNLYDVACRSNAVVVHGVLKISHKPLGKCVIALQCALLSHEVLHDCRSAPVGNENNNNSPAPMSQLESIPNCTHENRVVVVASVVTALINRIAVALLLRTVTEHGVL